MATLPVAALVLAAGATAVSAGGLVISGIQQKQAAKANAQAMEAQAEAEQRAAQIEAQQQERAAHLAELEAVREGEFQEYRERREREKQRFLSGQIIATTAASGLLLEGSPLYTLQENLRQTELGLLAGRTESEARQVASRNEAQARRFGADVTRFQGAERLRLGRFGANIQRFQGSQALTSSLIGAGGTLLTGAARGFRQYQAGQTISSNRGLLSQVDF